MTALGVDRFVVTLVDTKQGRQEQRRWNNAEISPSTAWLKRMNARGYDVWIRPDGEHGLVLLGGLNKSNIQKLQERGFSPATVVETNRDQYQAWVKLSERPLNEALRGLAAEGLVKPFGRSTAKTIRRVDGRLAGFSNQQVQRSGGRHPYVLVVECEGRVASAAPAYLERFHQVHMIERETHHDKWHSRSRGPER